MNNKIHNNNLNTNARQLRKNQTEQERKLWFAALKSVPVKFRRQVTIGNYVADFYCSKAKLVIEIDGAQHYEDEALEYDKKRTEYFNGLGLSVLRYTNDDLNVKFYDVCNDINKFLSDKGLI